PGAQTQLRIARTRAPRHDRADVGCRRKLHEVPRRWIAERYDRALLSGQRSRLDREDVSSMKAKIAALAAAILSVSFAGHAAAMEASDPVAQALMKGYFGNTRICRIDGLFECHMWLNPDGTYVLFAFNAVNEAGDGQFTDNRGGFHVDRGHWTIQGT